MVENPANALAPIIAALKGPDGRIRIPGFYDEVQPLSDADRAAIAALPLDEEALRDEIGVPALVGEQGFSVLERRGARPTLDVNGIWGGFQGEGAKTIIPAHAHAKVSCRLVPDQDPDVTFERLRDYVPEIAPPGVTRPSRTSTAGTPQPHAHRPSGDPGRGAGAARRRSASQPLYSREGGSIPVTVGVRPHASACRSSCWGSRSPTPDAHAPNEWLRARQLRRRDPDDHPVLGRARAHAG